MHYFKWFYLVGICLLMACSPAAEEELMESSPQPVTAEIPLEEALGTAEQMFAQLEGTTRGNVREVSSVKTFDVKASTRSGESWSPAYYLVNYGEDVA